ncbi:MAG: ATP-dependent helicase [Thiomicrospira sp.]|nr:ATP-dependent helicase [Thiomicrospira sp.]NCN66340.1 ATP-dependent helicase [Thiomicrospira sp.]NCO14794.1 ATP-dependent helicase [Thiomicrospira sp.]NCO82390.1 ATP-dependent helicase [Thiomicrospira sp.]OIP95481.1 MAG: hypothetical protein AUK56_05420 [Thiomicrospira sp. CG2_30_44_34]
MSNLNPHQQKCVSYEGHLLIVACPGSGKTTVLSHRANYLLEKYPNKNLLAVTFTKDAAEELKSRIQGRSPEAKRRIGAGTFHSLSKTLLIRGGYTVNLLSDVEMRAIIQDIVDNNFNENEVPKMKVILEKFSEIQSAIEPMKHPIIMRVPVMKFIFEEYERIKRTSRKMDFADLLYLSVREMRAGNLLPFAADYILGDESQDMDEVQHAWVKCHADHNSEITLVSDDDQSVYAFRQASGYEGLQQFKRELGAEQMLLPVNYRCGHKILGYAENLIQHNNPDRVDKPIEAGNPRMGRVVVTSAFPPPPDYNTVPEELVGVSNAILQHSQAWYSNDDTKNSLCEWAILARKNNILNHMEVALTENNLPFVRKSSSIWDVTIAKQYVYILKYLSTGEWFGMALYLKQFFNDETLFDPEVKCLMDAYEIASAELSEHEDILATLNNFVYMEQRWRSLLESDGDEGVDGVTSCIEDVASFVIANISDNFSEKKIGFFQSVVEICRDKLAKHKGQPLKKRIFKETFKFGSNEKALEAKKAEAIAKGIPIIHLLTLHGSKGLEFDNVVMVGCDDKNFLEPKSDGTLPNPHEERRLFYVGMTRAKNQLLLTCSLNKDVPPALDEKGNILVPSTFIREAAPGIEIVPNSNIILS